MKRFLIAVLSIVLFATIIAWVSYIPSVQREPNVYYFGFLDTFFFVLFMLDLFIYLQEYLFQSLLIS